MPSGGAPARMIALGADELIDPSSSKQEMGRCVLSTERGDVAHAHSVTHQLELGAGCRVIPGHICTGTGLTPLHIAAITPN